MSVPKSKRSKSSVEFESIYFRVADDIDNLVAHRFGASPEVYSAERYFIDSRSEKLERLTDELLIHIKIANSTYPTIIEELNERRIEMDKAIGICYAILTSYQRILTRLRMGDDRMAEPVKHVIHIINSLKAWRKADNKFKKIFENKEPLG